MSLLDCDQKEFLKLTPDYLVKHKFKFDGKYYSLTFNVKGGVYMCCYLLQKEEEWLLAQTKLVLELNEGIPVSTILDLHVCIENIKRRQLEIINLYEKKILGLGSH